MLILSILFYNLKIQLYSHYYFTSKRLHVFSFCTCTSIKQIYECEEQSNIWIFVSALIYEYMYTKFHGLLECFVTLGTHSQLCRGQMSHICDINPLRVKSNHRDSSVGHKRRIVILFCK